jgi:hypothetical protein
MNTENMFNGMFGKIEPGMCRLSMNGGIAVKTSNGYKTYNMKKGRLVNCTSFCFDIGQEFFFVIPTNRVEVGDIILVNGKPKCVKAVKKEEIIVINYEDSTVDTILPERHVFMGNTYFYGKIVSMFGSNLGKGKNGMNNMLKYMMLSELMKGSSGNNMFGTDSNNQMSNMLPLMMLTGGNAGSLFDGMLDFDDDDTEDINLFDMSDTDDEDDTEEEE